MVICKKDDRWPLRMEPDNSPSPPEPYVFLIESVKPTGETKGKVTIGNVTADFTGNCRKTKQGDKLLDFLFHNGNTQYFLGGTVIDISGSSKFIGRYKKLGGTGVTQQGKSTPLDASPPDLGDTGTGTGQQTKK